MENVYGGFRVDELFCIFLFLFLKEFLEATINQILIASVILEIINLVQLYSYMHFCVHATGFSLFEIGWAFLYESHT